MEKPSIKNGKIVNLLRTKFLNVSDYQFFEGGHYYTVTRRKDDDLVVLKSDEEFKELTADAVQCLVVVRNDDGDRLLVFQEFRYPVGQYLLSVPAGLIDPADKASENALKTSAVRELYEETGLSFKDGDTFKVVLPSVLSSPGFCDETNAVCLFVLNNPDLSSMNDSNKESTECFADYELIDKKTALEYIKTGKDKDGKMYSIYTFAALLYFVSDLWK